MKLNDYHSCDSFASNNSGSLSMHDMALARDLAIKCQAAMKKTMSQIVSLVTVIYSSVDSGQLTEARLAPWLLNCVYRAVVGLSWIGSSSAPEKAEEYKNAKSICIDMLQRVDKRWKMAGELNDELLRCCTLMSRRKLIESLGRCLVRGNCTSRTGFGCRELLEANQPRIRRFPKLYCVDTECLL